MPHKFHCIFMYQTNLIFICVALTFMAFGFGTKENQKSNIFLLFLNCLRKRMPDNIHCIFMYRKYLMLLLLTFMKIGLGTETHICICIICK